MFVHFSMKMFKISISLLFTNENEWFPWNVCCVSCCSMTNAGPARKSTASHSTVYNKQALPGEEIVRTLRTRTQIHSVKNICHPRKYSALVHNKRTASDTCIHFQGRLHRSLALSVWWRRSPMTFSSVIRESSKRFQLPRIRISGSLWSPLAIHTLS